MAPPPVASPGPALGEESPETSPEELRELLAEASNVFAEYVQQSQQPHASVVSERRASELRQDLDLLRFPEEGAGQRGIWSDVQAVCDAATNTWSSKFLYKLYAAPTPIGVVGEALMGLLNNNAHVFHASPVGMLVESSVAAKLAELAGFPAQTAGLTFPGGSYANMHALMTARNRRFPEIKHKGLYALSGVRPVVFTSRHSHYSIDKAAMAAGIGLDGVIHVPTDSTGSMRVAELRRMMQHAIDSGQTPFFVNATMGTTVLGACDPLEDIAAVCKEYSVWLHVDGSWGGPLALFAESPDMAPTFVMPHGRVDSMSVNPHKLLGVPLQCSFLLVREGLDVMRQALGLNASYLFHSEGSDGEESQPGEGNLDVGDATLGCGRRPDALKFWLMWRYYGTRYFINRVSHARRMALRLAEMCNDTWGQVTCRLCCRINAAGNFLIDYATIDMFRYGASSSGGAMPRGDLERYTLPAFFRIPLNSPDVSEDTLVAVLGVIEQAASELYH